MKKGSTLVVIVAILFIAIALFLTVIFAYSFLKTKSLNDLSKPGKNTQLKQVSILPREKPEDGIVKTDINQIGSALLLYIKDKNIFPSNLQVLVTEDIFKPSIPMSPYGVSYSYLISSDKKSAVVFGSLSTNKTYCWSSKQGLASTVDAASSCLP